ncbi:RNA polymerase sigma factor [Flavobacterium sp.]|jgi:DNA-directed RNA polymerase specialized sigma24 family protein|uniref:RNA polymerase sigma factor n=1 Tax=Flavobacterium sp. TaxID=239 RepID=UPI0037BFB048
MSSNKADFQSIYKQYNLMVYNVGLHYLQNIEDAEEITQDVFIQIHGSLGTFNEKSSLKTWIYRIAINKSLDFLKQKKVPNGFLFLAKNLKINGNFTIIRTLNIPELLWNKKKMRPFYLLLSTN